MTFDQFLLLCALDQGLMPMSGEVQSEWGSDHPQHRLKIKKAALACVHSSISHCPQMGGFIGLAQGHPPTLQLGFDIEDIARVTDLVAERVAHPKDHAVSGRSPALLWSAREASYKALAGPCQPQVISQIALIHWKPREHDIYQFDFITSGLNAGHGYAWNDEEFQFAITFWTPDSHIEKGIR